MRDSETALVLIGFQNDYFADGGALRRAFEDPESVTRVRLRTLRLIEALAPTGVTLVSTPIHFTADYGELIDPTGILKTIRDVGAFRAGAPGSESIAELGRFGDRVLEVVGKRGLDAFSNTSLDEVLRARGVRDVVLAGLVTAICVDSTGRRAAELGYRVTILSDCTAGRTTFEQDYYCSEVFPLYASVLSSAELGASLAERRP